MRGSDFIQTIIGMGLTPAREQAIFEAATTGGMVVWPMTEISVNAGGHVISFQVADDYFAIGQPGDYVRVPMGPLTAQRLGDALGFLLPTARMVDLIYKAATTKIEPQPNTAVTGTTAQMSTATFAQHSADIDASLAKAGYQGGLVGGIKKDVVLSNRLVDPKICFAKGVGVPVPYCVAGWTRVGIYGWHKSQPTGNYSRMPTLPGLYPIQGLSLVHEKEYADYSHGIRMVAPTATVDGQPMALVDVLTSPELGSILSHEGPLVITRYTGTPPTGQPPPVNSLVPQPTTLPPPTQRVLVSEGNANATPIVLAAGVSSGSKFAAFVAGAVAAYYGWEWLKRRRFA